MIKPDDVLPESLSNRASTTRYAAELFLVGGSATGGKPCRSIPRLSKITGVAISTLRRSHDEDGWEKQALSLAIKNQLGSLSALPDHADRVERLNDRAETMLGKYLSLDVSDEKAEELLGQLERLLKLCGHEKRLAISAKVEERIRLDQLKKHQVEEGATDYGDGSRVLDVD